MAQGSTGCSPVASAKLCFNDEMFESRQVLALQLLQDIDEQQIRDDLKSYFLARGSADSLLIHFEEGGTEILHIADPIEIQDVTLKVEYKTSRICFISVWISIGVDPLIKATADIIYGDDLKVRSVMFYCT